MLLGRSYGQQSLGFIKDFIHGIVALDRCILVDSNGLFLGLKSWLIFLFLKAVNCFN